MVDTSDESAQLCAEVMTATTDIIAHHLNKIESQFHKAAIMYALGCDILGAALQLMHPGVDAQDMEKGDIGKGLRNIKDQVCTQYEHHSNLVKKGKSKWM